MNKDLSYLEFFVLLTSVFAITIGVGSAFFVMGFIITDSGIIGDDKPNVYNVEQDNSLTDSDKLLSDSMDSTVSVLVDDPDSDDLQNQGSGFVYTTENHIVTNEHVTNSSEDFYVEFRDGEWEEAELIGEDNDTDIAVLQVDSTPDYAEPLPISDSVDRGTGVYAIGSPSNLSQSVSDGIVSGTDRSMEVSEGYSIPDMVQTDAALNPGNSGGPLISKEDGSVVGVNRATEGENLGFAVSSSLMDRVAQSLIDNGEHAHSHIGISTIEYSPELENYDDIDIEKGLIVADMLEDSPAKELDLKIGEDQGDDLTQNDIIKEVDGERITTNEELSSYLLLETSPKDTIELTILRDGEEKNMELTLDVR